MPDQPMMPRGDGPSTHPLAHTLWTFEIARKHGENNVTRYELDGERPATVYVNNDVALSSADRDAIFDIIRTNHGIEHEARSFWHRLTTPVRHKCGELEATSVQMKGVVFDRSMSFQVYTGIGFRAECYFADSDGRMRRYHMPADAIGTCSVTEELREFNNLREFTLRLKGAPVHVPMPIAWGEFHDVSYEGDDLGFGVFGLPDVVAPRDAHYYDALTAFTGSNDFTPMRDALRGRAAALATMHKAGITAIFRHFGNMSLTPSGEVLMHDLGSLRVSTREEHVSDEQFIAEALCNLASALTPADIVIPGAHRYDEAYPAVRNNLAQYTQATLQGYFGIDSPLAKTSFETFEETFLAAFDTPLSELSLPFAQQYRDILRSWIAD